MIRHICVGAVLMLLFNIEKIFCLNPPQDVRLFKTYLQWKKPPDDDDNVLYSLQYKLGSNPDDEWHCVTNYSRTELSFKITPELYGAKLRVRAEKGNSISEWQYSNKVKCVNANSCVPVMTLSVKPETVCVSMAHMDDSLKKEYGDNIEFNVSFWKVDNAGFLKVEFFILTGKNKCFHILESGQKYCFQVQYLFYENPYGNVSNQSCVFIPESSEKGALLISILTTLLVTATCGVCIFLLFKHHKKVKKLLQPLSLEIPNHYQEFFRSEEFPLHKCTSPSSQSLRSYDMITVIENSNMEQQGQEEEQEKRSLT
ncbi:hypothetical protein Q8A67_003898 [Cirrhinus molitorella]|uniref:Uncharacterized protein n=1 Tax=Cirrhinus molitorella TaxID=172907 RepID=A0AA88Q1I1_9TELE|nr:hypothetical protein Q8A67_003898 [Cirrhinus molitorella]